MRCTWCNTPLAPTERITLTPNGQFRCFDGGACAARHGELPWATSISEARRYGGGLSGRYCCLDPACEHPPQQVFNGGAG